MNFKRASLAHGNKSGPVTRLVREACPVGNYFEFLVEKAGSDSDCPGLFCCVDCSRGSIARYGVV